jgi:hypothetical protein
VALAFSLLLLARYGRQPDTATLGIVKHALVSPPGTDSTLYMQMGETAFQSGSHRIYAQLFFTEHQKFIYPPSSLFLTEALNALPRLHLSQSFVWKMLLLLGWAGSLITGMFFYRTQRRQASALELTAVALLGVLFLPFAEAFYRGQVQMLLTFLWGVSLLLWTRRKTGWAGIILALTCMFKPQLAIFVLWGLVRREWRFTIAFAATAAAALGCSIIHFGWQNHLDYLAVLSYLSRHGEALWANQSMNGLLNRLLSNGDPSSWNPTVYAPYRPVIYAVSTCFSVVCLAAGLLLPRLLGWSRTTADFLFFGCLSVLMSPIAWEHHYGYFFFAFVFLLARAETSSRPHWIVLAFCLLAMSNRLPRLDFLFYGPQSLLGDYLFFSGIAVLGLLALQTGSERSSPPVPRYVSNGPHP